MKKAGRTILVFLVLLSLFVLSGCGSLEEAMEKAKTMVPKDWDLVHTEQVQENAVVVFYMRNNDLGAGLFQKESFGWEWVGSGLGTLVTQPSGLSWRYSDLGKSKTQFSVFYGLVTNPAITSVQVKTTFGQTAKAKIVESNGLKLWLAFIDKPQIPSVDADIIGYSESGEVLYLFSQPKQGSK
ncbi:MAG: hypothetical protein M0T74_17800 [Desulfitobacterium hafniense]|nr:hypothetical protein [Desulfitobacterium hafniense]